MERGPGHVVPEHFEIDQLEKRRGLLVYQPNINQYQSLSAVRQYHSDPCLVT